MPESVDEEDEDKENTAQSVVDDDTGDSGRPHVPVICGQNRVTMNGQEAKKTPTKKFLTGAKDFSKLVRRFSGSEGSSSEPAMKERSPTPPKRFVMRKPEIPAALRNTSEETVALRKTPERTQSLRDTRNKTPPRDGVTRRSSFNTADVVRRKYQTNTQPDQELFKILNRRSRNLEEYEEELAKNKTPSAEMLVTRFESNLKKRNSATADDVTGVVDQEMLSILLSRRAKTDSDSASEDATSDVTTTPSVKKRKGSHDSGTGLHSTIPEDGQDGREDCDDKPLPILKHKSEAAEKDTQPTKVVPILKKKEEFEHDDAGWMTVTSILKHKSSSEEAKAAMADSDIKPILKHSFDAEPEPTEIPSSILRRKSSGEESDSPPQKPQPILKRDSSEEAETSPKHKTHSMLTKHASGSSSVDHPDAAASKLPSILKKHEDGSTITATTADHPAEVKSQDHKTKGGDVKLKSVLRKSSLKLSKESTSPASNLDPELAMVLARRKLSVDVEDEPTDNALPAESVQSPSVIRPVRDVERGDAGDDSAEKQLSVAERIYMMENKIEEESSLSSKSGSGRTTPCLIPSLRSGSPSPDKKPSGGQLAAVSDEQNTSSGSAAVISDAQLLEKLNDAAAMRRRRFQTRDRNDWRARTQPITEEEISVADSLDSVSSFRAEINKRACLNIFRDLQTETAKPQPQVTKKGKKDLGLECYPEHYKKKDKKPSSRRNGERYKTLPVTLTELSEIKETAEPIVKPETPAVRQKSPGVTGSESDLDLDKLVAINLDDAKKQVTEELQKKEQQQQQHTHSTKSKYKSKSIWRFQDRKKRNERSLTQPITEEEVKEAADMAEDNGASAGGAASPGGGAEASQTAEKTESGDELSKLSISEKLKLFSQKQKEVLQAKPSTSHTHVHKRARRLQSRFKTQPVTPEELEKASRISPLAVTLVKPPDPDIIQGLPLKDQRAMMAQWAEKTLSASKSTQLKVTDAGSSARRGSDSNILSDQAAVKGILRSVDSSQDQRHGILKSPPNTEKSVHSILKADHPPSSESAPSQQTVTSSHDPSLSSDQHRGILKHIDTKKESETKGILKKDSSFEKHLEKESSSSATASHGVLKKEIQSEHREMKSILKDSSFDAVEKVTEADQQSPAASHTATTRSERVQVTRRTTTSVTTTSSAAANATESSPEKGRVIKNEAVAARKKKREMRNARDRFHTQPIESEEVKTEEKHVVSKRVTERHLTQPITKIEHEQVTEDSEMNRASIAERLAALQKDGEERWRKRVSPLRENTLANRNHGNSGGRPTSIVDRLSKLEESKAGWKNRVGETDAVQFTVAGKLAKDGKSRLITDSPVARKKVSPKKIPDFDSSESSTPPLSPTKLPKSRFTLSGEEKTTSSSEEEKPAPVKIEVPKANDETFSTFFKTTTTKVVVSEKTEVSIDDFNHIFLESGEILQSAKRVRPIRKQAGSRNPLKKLAMRDDIQLQYEESQSGVAERELKRIKRDQIASSASLAESALAGLASKENFSQVALKKADSFTAGSHNKHEPFKETMLIQVKGRRHVQARLVEPQAKSINSGDCFVLVVPDRVFLWTGEYANVIEKAKASELALSILQKKDLCCRSLLTDVQNVMEKKPHTAATKTFWDTLGGETAYQETGPADEDELYEMYTVATNMIYRVKGDELVPYEEYWGVMPKYGMLDPKEVFVLDFGSELYIWTGKKVPFNKRKNAIRLATKLWEQGYNYSECDINPIYPILLEEGAPKPCMKSATRPPWAVFGKINQDMETCLFKEKFLDWPDSSQIIKVKGSDNDGDTKAVDPTIDLKPFDAKEMLHAEKRPVTLILDGANVARGTRWIEDHEGLRREYEVQTLAIVVWHVLEFGVSKMDTSSHGQFHEGDTYVVRWQYMIRQQGLKTLKGGAARPSQTGRERCAYFFWQGKESGITEKGASALMTVELDEERGPQVRVVQGKEPPAFMNLFKSQMIVHIGKREEEETNTQGPWRLYITRNELPTEAFLQEVVCEVQSLRSQASFLLLNVHTGLLYVWHGAKSSKHARSNATTIARALRKSCPAEVALHQKASVLIMEMEEGTEKRGFCKALGLNEESRANYHSLLKYTKFAPHTPRLFYLNSVSGTFVATEIQNLTRQDECATIFPFLQSDLYKVSQPALFLLDNSEEVYLWQGWWPEGDEDVENVHTGSAESRFNANRKCAMETTLNYCQEKNQSRPVTAYLIHAGVEPVRFINLFPYWEPDDVVTEIAKKSGKRLQRTLVKDVFQQLSRTRFTLQELRAENLPEGVDTLKLESYLDDKEFQEALGMNRQDFYALPAWKQSNLKKNASLF